MHFWYIFWLLVGVLVVSVGVVMVVNIKFLGLLFTVYGAKDFPAPLTHVLTLSLFKL